MVLGRPKLGFGEAGINAHVGDIVGGKHELVGGPASVIGVRAKLPIPGTTKPLVDDGHAVVPLKMALLAASL